MPQAPLSSQIADFLITAFREATGENFVLRDEKFDFDVLHWADAVYEIVDFRNDWAVLRVTLDPRCTSSESHEFIIKVEKCS